MNKNFSIKIFMTSDTHGNVLPINYANNLREGKGLTKIASYIKKERTKNSILIDLGDSIQGSPLMYFHHLNYKKYPNPVAKIFNYLNYDFFVPGNHDFNYGQEYLYDFLKQNNAKTLSANIFRKNDLAFDKPYEIIKYEQGPSICIIGLTTQYIPHWENPSNIKDLRFENALDTCKKCIQEVKENNEIDLFVVAYHGGFEYDLKTGSYYVKDTGENLGSRMISEIPEIGVLLTGHQHRIISENINGKSIIQPGGNAMNIGVVDLEFEFKNNHWEVIKKDPKLVSVSELESDEYAENLVKEVETENQKFLDQTIGIVKHDNLKITDEFQARLKKHPIVTFINDIQLSVSGAQLSSTSLANSVSGFDKEISIRNVLSTYVYPNTLVVVEISGKVLKEYLERNAEYFVIENDKIVANPRFSYPKNEHYNYDMVDGIDYVINVSKPFGERVSNIIYKNKEVNPSDKFTLVMNNYRASGGGDFEMLSDIKIVKEISLGIAELMIDFIRENKIINVEEKENIKVIK